MKLLKLRFAIIIFATLFSFLAPTLKAQVNIQDSLTLVDFYDSLGQGYLLHRWQVPAPVSTWYGVSVDSNNRVTSLILNGIGLNGSIPASLGNLNKLTHLDMSNNTLSASIPSSLGNLTNLTYLNLNENNLTNSIPSSFGNLTNLTYLDLNQNKLSGSIPSSLGNLTNLNYLDFDDNQLSGSIPASMGNLTNLTKLFLRNNRLSGTIPESLGKLANLVLLILRYNQLSGAIPDSLGNLYNLQFLDLGNNQLSDSIPSSLGNLKQVQYFYLYGNQLSGSIPASLGNLTNVLQLQLWNNKLTGAIPPSLGNLPNITDLELYGNQLSDTIPSSLGKLTTLTILDFWNNHLTGSIPTSFGNLTNMHELYLSTNQLSGSIPSSLGNMTSLHYFYLDSNRLSGSIPASLGNCDMYYMILNDNKLSGSIPSSLGNMTHIGVVNLSNNQLSGSIPSSLGNISNLNTLYLNNNQLSGTIPSSLDHMPKLGWVYLGTNQLTFSGMEGIARISSFTYYSPQAIVPLTLKKSDTTFSVSVGGTPTNNTFKWFNSGTLAATIKSDSTYRPTSNGLYYVAATNAVATKLTLYSDSIIINYPTNPQDSLALVDLYNSTGGATWVNHKNWLTKLPVNTWYGVTEYNWRVTGISLDSNNLKGTIPSSLGNMTKLQYLFLSNNQLSGSIPASLGKITNLVVLYLDFNQLSGSIPTSLKNLTNLSDLNLGVNKFTFAGMENVVNLAHGGNFYAPQATISLFQNGNKLSVSVGDIPNNNTYRWYKNGTLMSTTKSDSTYTLTSNGKYWVVATNAVATGLTLYSDTIVASPLPIKVIDLQAKKANRQVLLQWQTIDEINTSHFIIQHSTDGSSFTDIGTVRAISSGANGYSFMDNSPTNGINYYRLKSVDKDGTSSYSKVVSVQFTVNSDQLTVFPNPSKNKITVQGGHIASVQVVDNMGRVIKIQALKDATNPILSVGGLPVGVYHLRVQTTDGKVSGVGFVKE